MRGAIMDKNIQTNRQKAYFHSARAEYWQILVQQYEDEAMAKGRVRGKNRPSVAGEVYDTTYIAKSLLRDNNGYTMACNNRNAHQQQATMYGILALLDG